MRCTAYYRSLLVLCLLITVSTTVSYAQDSLKTLPVRTADKIRSNTDRVEKALSITSASDTLTGKVSPDSIQLKLSAAQNRLQQSLHVSDPDQARWMRKLDSINASGLSPDEKYKALLSFEEKMTKELPGKNQLDSLRNLEQKAAGVMSDVDKVSSDLGIGQLGKRDQLVSNELEMKSGLPAAGEKPGIPALNTPDINAPQLPSVQVPSNPVATPGKIRDVLQQSGEITEKTTAYADQVKTIREGGLDSAGTVSDIAEDQVTKLEPVQDLQQMTKKSTGQMELYQKMVEEYKNQKKIEEEMKEKSKEVANDVLMKQEDKISGSMKNLRKYKAKFSYVPDLRKLPKRAPNPVKDLPLRERISPGFLLQAISASPDPFLQIDPQVTFRLYRPWDIGVGGMYRFSMNPSRLTFHDFGSLYGTKVFVNCRLFSGFYIIAEGQAYRWKPVPRAGADSSVKLNSSMIAGGIGKRYQIGNSVSGEMHLLYHHTLTTPDAYKPKILVRIGINFSLKKRAKPHWKKAIQKKEESKDAEKSSSR